MQQSFDFDDENESVSIAPGAYWLRGFCVPVAEAIVALVRRRCEEYPPQTMMTPMGYPMSVKTTSFGAIGWQGDHQGYGYAKLADTQAGQDNIPTLLLDLAQSAANAAGYHDFLPDTCLVNIYEVGAKMGLHQDKDERDFTQPILSVSLGISATFLFGGDKRTDTTVKIPVEHGDVIVWGGESRRYYHGVNPVLAAKHPLLGAKRINLTFRKAL